MAGRGWVLALAVVVAGFGCKPEREAEGEGSAARAGASAELPADEAAFLTSLLPLPDGASAIEIHYRVEGPALEGEMDVALGPGGVRRDRWELRSKAGDSYLRAAGSRIVSAERVWTAAAGQPGTIVDNHLHGFAQAYLARDAEAQAKIVEAVRIWHETLTEQRKRAGGEQHELLGVTCLRTRIAGQNVCMWEEVGVLLEYEGSAFEIVAERIDRNPELADDTFELPAIAAKAEKGSSEAPDYDAILDEIAAGSYGSLSTLVHANVALPDLDAK